MEDNSSAATPEAPSLDFVFEVEASVGPPLVIGRVDGVERRIIPVLGGIVRRPRFSGRVLAGGADWQSIRADGVAEILARYTLEADDGTLVGVTNPGIRRGPPEVMRRLAEGQPVDPGSYYFRTTPRFEVAAEPYRWLAESVFVCQGIRHPDRVVIRFFQVL